MISGKRALPFKLAIVSALAVGAAVAWRQGHMPVYLEYSMHKTLAWELAGLVDRLMLFGLLIFYTAAVLILFDGRLSGRRRLLLRGLVSVAVVLGLTVYLVLQRVLTPSLVRQVSDVARFAARDYGLALLLAAACVSAGTWFVLRSGRTARRNSGADTRDSYSALLAVISRSKILTAVSIAFLALGILVNAAAGFLWARNHLAARSKPNIIWIMADSLRADHLGCYGYGRSTSPNLDRFARRSTRFERAFSQAPMTFQSLPSFLTGAYPNSASRTVSIFNVLRDRGYSTSALIGNPVCTQRVLRKYLDADHFDGRPAETDISSPALISGAKRCLNRSRKPFFIFMLFMDTHSPYIWHPEHDFPGRSAKYPETVKIANDHPEVRSYDRDYLDHLRSLYDSDLAYTDEHIGRLFEELRSRGLYDDSLIIFMSDHGEEFGEHGRLFHAHTLYNEVLHVPVIVKLPGQMKGKLSREMTPLLDLYPTVVEHAGGAASPRLPGRAITTRTSVATGRDRRIFSVVDYRSSISKRSVIDGRLKGIVDLSMGHDELYDLLSDPEETSNLATEKPEVMAGFRKLLLDREKAFSAAIGKDSVPGDEDLTESESKRFRSLGYVQ